MPENEKRESKESKGESERASWMLGGKWLSEISIARVSPCSVDR